MTIRIVDAPVVWDLRQQVLRPSQTIAEMEWPRDFDAGTLHFAAFDDDEVVGILTAYEATFPELPSQLHAWQLRGMAASAPRRGIGTELLRYCMEECERRGAELLWCQARISAAGFYETFGFQRIGPEFEKPHAGPHVLMFRQLDRSA